MCFILIFDFFVVWIKLLSNQIHISQVLESLRPISQMINIPFMPEILWDETFLPFWYATTIKQKEEISVNKVNPLGFLSTCFGFWPPLHF